MRRAASQRGSALVIVIILIVMMMALSATYVGTSVTISEKNFHDEQISKARSVAASGLDVAMAELRLSVAGHLGCRHMQAGAKGSTGKPVNCWGNIDGNVFNPSMTVASGIQPPAIPTTFAGFPAGGDGYPRTSLESGDSLNIDTGGATGDGFPDFKDQTATQPQVALNGTEPDGTYTVRCYPVGSPELAQSGGYKYCLSQPDPISGQYTIPIYQAYRVRAYGIYKGQVAGIEAFISVPSPLNSPPMFSYGFASQNELTTGYGFTTDSFKSGFPVDQGGSFTGIQTFASDTNPADRGHGDVSAGNKNGLPNGDVNIQGTAAHPTAVNGGVTYTDTINTGVGTVGGTSFANGAPGNATPPPTQNVSIPRPTGTDLTSAIQTANGGAMGSDNQPAVTSGHTFNMGGVAGNNVPAAFVNVDGTLKDGVSFQMNGLQVNGGTVNIYPPSGGTVNLFVNEDFQVTNNGAFVIHQPAAGPPGVVNVYLSTTYNHVTGAWLNQDGPQTLLYGNGTTSGVVNTSAPGTFNLITDNSEYIKVGPVPGVAGATGGFNGTIMAPNSTNGGLTIADNTTITGAITASHITAGNNVVVHFDRSLMNSNNNGAKPPVDVPYRVLAFMEIAGKGGR